MIDYTPTPAWPATVPLLDVDTPVLGGLDGPDNAATKVLADGMCYVNARIDAAALDGVMPLRSIQYPAIDTATNTLVVLPAADAGTGGKVSVSAGHRLALAKSIVDGATGKLGAYTTIDYTSSAMLVNSIYYLRAQIVDSTLTLYVQAGTDNDTAPSSMKGTPGAGSGGGFPSTPVDALLAKIVTGGAGTAPTVASIANRAGFMSQAQYTQLAAAAPLDSPALTGTPTAPTPPAENASTRIATTAFVRTEIGNIAAGTETRAGVLELATEAETLTGTDASRAVHPAGLKSALNLKAPLLSPPLTGVPTAPTAAANTNSTQLATTAFVATAIDNFANGFLTTLNNPGRLVLPSGLILQWANCAAQAGGSAITFPNSFPNAGLIVIMGSGNSNGVDIAAGVPTKSGFTAYAATGSGHTGRYLAIGY